MKHLLTFLLAFLTFGIYAQDQLFKKDNTKLDVKILEINQTEIKYKLFTYQDGPTIIIAKSDVALIIYQNGVHEVFNQQAPPTPQPIVIYHDNLPRKKQQKLDTDSAKLAHYNEVTSTKNLVALNLLETFNSGFGLSYLREFANGYLNVYVPVNIGISEPMLNQPGNIIFGNYNNQYYIQNFKYKRKTVETGIGIHFQTSGKRAVTHFVGPYIGISQFTGSYNSNDYYSANYPSYSQNLIPHSFVMNRYTFMLDNGVLFRITKNFNMILLAGIGYHVDDFIANNPKNYANNGYYYNTFDSFFPINSIKLNMSLGYRF